MQSSEAVDECSLIILVSSITTTKYKLSIYSYIKWYHTFSGQETSLCLTVCCWFHAYLSEKTQVNCHINLSFKGVPQGSVLDLLLFAIYISNVIILTQTYDIIFMQMIQWFVYILGMCKAQCIYICWGSKIICICIWMNWNLA